jgi:putative ABC transport system permease protein
MIPLRYNLRSLLVRRMTSVMTALCVALVVMILFILLGLIAGLRHAAAEAVDDGNWIIVSHAATSEPASFISHEQYEIIRSRTEIETDSKGNALASAEMMTGFNADPDARPGHTLFTFLRGVYPVAREVHRGMRIVAGRWPERGTAEMVVGQKLAARFPNLSVGREFRFGRRTFRIVGTFSDSGSARESEVWTDLDILTQEVRYMNGFSVLFVKLRPGLEDEFSHSLTTDSRLKVDVMRAGKFYTQQTEFVDQLRGLGLIVASILAIGAVFGAMNTMYAAVARRSSEIGVLRVLGFSPANVLASFVAESVLLGLAGGIAGELLGIVVAGLTGLSSRQMNVGQYIFSFRLASSAFVAGLTAAAIIGALGGLMPAWRASRTRMIETLRAV